MTNQMAILHSKICFSHVSHTVNQACIKLSMRNGPIILMAHLIIGYI